MKLCKFTAALLLCMTLVFGLTACTAESTEDLTETEKALAETTEAPAETAEEVPEVDAAFASRLDYVAEKEGNVECVILLKALEGSFKEDVKPEEITFGEGIAEASEVEIAADGDTVLEVGFVIPKGDLDVDNFSVTGSLLLADGVLLDTRGNAVGEMGEMTVYEMDMTDRASGEGEGGLTYPPGSLRLIHDGAYIARFYVSWDVVTWDNAHMDIDGTVHLSADSKEVSVERRSWSRNGDNVTSSLDTVIELPGNARNLSITAQGYTAVAWNPWITSYHKDGLQLHSPYPNMTLTIYGTSLHQKADMRMD